MPRRQSAEINCHVGARLRSRRVELGLTQANLGGLIGKTYQQIAKYETGVNRVAASVLHELTQCLAVDHGYFFQGLDSGEPPALSAAQQACIQVVQSLRAMSPEHRLLVADVARRLAGSDGAELSLNLKE